MTNAKKIYLAGPMTGLPEFNFPAFHRAAGVLRALGYLVVNPAEVNPDVSMPWEVCMKRCIPMVLACDALCCLPGWEKSRGTMLEVFIAGSVGMDVLMYTSLCREALE